MKWKEMELEERELPCRPAERKSIYREESFVYLSFSSVPQENPNFPPHDSITWVRKCYNEHLKQIKMR